MLVGRSERLSQSTSSQPTGVLVQTIITIKVDHGNIVGTLMHALSHSFSQSSCVCVSVARVLCCTAEVPDPSI